MKSKAIKFKPLYSNHIITPKQFIVKKFAAVITVIAVNVAVVVIAVIAVNVATVVIAVTIATANNQ